MSDQGRLVAGRYRLTELIGRGGMGTVWRADDELLGRQVAVKKLRVPPQLHDDERERLYERTRREARSAARIAHPNVVVVHDVVEDEGLPCIVMEYVPSRTLGDVLKKDGPITPREAARIGRGMVAALRAAHRAGVLHRDVKPANVLLGLEAPDGDEGWPGGRIVLTDFGIASATGTSTLTRTGELIGSFDFLAPERITGGTPGPACDLWALGATLYQAVEGEAPFHRDTPIETAYAIASEPVPPPRKAGPLAPLIEALLAKDPEERMTAEQAERLLVSSVETVMVAGTGASAGWSAPDDGPAEEPTEVVPPAPRSTGTGPTQPVPDVTPGTVAPPPARRSRRAAAVAVVTAVAAAALATGGYLLVHGHSAATTAGRNTATTHPTPPPHPPSAVPLPGAPAGYRLVHDSAGFTVAVPEGWHHLANPPAPNESDWIDPTGKVDLKISTLDYAGPSPLQHWQSLVAAVESQSPGYHLLRMNPTTVKVAGQTEPAAIWEYTWQGKARTWHAIDLGFGKEGGTEYAVYLSAPDLQWPDRLPVFSTAATTFRPGPR